MAQYACVFSLIHYLKWLNRYDGAHCALCATLKWNSIFSYWNILAFRLYFNWYLTLFNTFTSFSWLILRWFLFSKFGDCYCNKQCVCGKKKMSKVKVLRDKNSKTLVFGGRKQQKSICRRKKDDHTLNQTIGNHFYQKKWTCLSNIQN